jgi:hypothetical protein
MIKLGEAIEQCKYQLSKIKEIRREERPFLYECECCDLEK